MSRVLLLFTFLSFIGLSLAQAQNRQLTGTVKDKKDGQTLIGVSVALAGTKNGTSTDANGTFKISIPANGAVLTFTYIGYKTKNVTVTNETKLSVTLDEDANNLEEVTVNVGYGVVRKKDLTGAVGSVGADVIAAAPVSSALEAIQGRVAGINISSTEGSPNAELTVRVRGGGSITGDNSPLYIVDGFPVATIADIAPQDIESIDILKDASSTAIYGSRGANGVILVTTKNSKNGKTTISLNVFGGVRNLAKKLDVLTPYDYVTWQYERALLDKSLTDYTQYFGNYQDIDLYQNVAANDWQEIIFGRTGNTFNSNLSINGGGEKTKYSLSHSYVKDKAIMQLSDYERQNVNFKLNHKLYKGLTLDFGFRYANAKTKGGGSNEQNEVSSADSRLKNAMIYPPFPVVGLTTTTETNEEFNLYSPLISISDNDQYIQRKTFNINGALSYDIIDNLRFKSEVGFDDLRNNQDRYYGNTTYYVRNVPSGPNQNKPAVIFTNTSRNSIRNANTLNYSFGKILDKKHNLNVLLGQEYIKTELQVLTNTVHGFPTSFTFQDTRFLSTQGQANSIDNNFSPDDKLLSFFGRANYDYLGKYLISATFRADGSSKFSPENRWGYFPSASAAWRISQEDFMKGTKSWLSDLKLRLSYGTAGNNNIPPGQMTQSLQNSVTTWVNGFGNYWAASKTMANPDLKWETTVTRNIGLDFSLLGSKLTGTVDAYLNKTKDLLIAFPVAGTGYDFQYRNIGSTQNKGLELSLNWNAIRKTNFDLSFNANISINRNKVLSLGSVKNINGSAGWASTEIGVDYLVEENASVGRIFGYRNAGRYEVSDFSGYNATTGNWTLKPGIVDGSAFLGTIRPGTMKIEDISGDGKIDQSDRTIIGNANPLNTGGFSINSRIYNFDIGAYFNWSYGNDIYNANKIEYTSTSKYNSRNMISEMATGNRWTNLRADGTISNDPAELSAMNANTTLWSPYMKSFVLSDWAVEDGSFLRLSTLTLGYTLPDKIASKLKMKKLRVYASAYNLWLWTNYTGFDPEVSTRRRTPLTPGVDYSAYPKSQSFLLGLNVNF
ncbi:SusC/RagA family TonB-linked outer membrane protein [Pedobacter alluvionis]|uniref:TonB-dependent receptor n=1 Tax=Pedobacter alluvionis TaxID=475253 RepID=A0A497XVL8_9SPHI|nr:TonB-dependent receptor [Pedobacter alluvionis]RLJ73783.1 TonB-linked SusC/RagA family outer membrane protein [Pedobacter alluvionis]TFB32604.1 TonB-dependent receptor [Pedobacter alluvionis]